MKTKYIIASVWAFAEATFFFFIPDIYLTRIALFDVRKAIIACFYAALSACLGGALMYYWGQINYPHAADFLLYIPGIFPKLLNQVINNVSVAPYFELFLAPLKGIPYKIYAVVFGNFRLNFWMFLLFSFLARVARFLLTTLLAGFLAKHLSKYWPKKKLIYCHIYAWGIIYCLYLTLDVYSYY